MPDLTYFEDGIFTAFYPESVSGEKVWAMMQEQGGDKVLSVHAQSVLNQLRKAGYKVRKRRIDDADRIDDAALLAQLFS